MRVESRAAFPGPCRVGVVSALVLLLAFSIAPAPLAAQDAEKQEKKDKPAPESQQQSSEEQGEEKKVLAFRTGSLIDADGERIEGATMMYPPSPRISSRWRATRARVSSSRLFLRGLAA